MNTETTLESPAIPPLPPAHGSASFWAVDDADERAIAEETERELHQAALECSDEWQP